MKCPSSLREIFLPSLWQTIPPDLSPFNLFDETLTLSSLSISISCTSQVIYSKAGDSWDTQPDWDQNKDSPEAKARSRWQRSMLPFPMTGDPGDVAKHTHECMREAEDSGQKARGLSSTKSQRTPSQVKLPGSSPRHLACPSYMLQVYFLFLFYAFIFYFM